MAEKCSLKRNRQLPRGRRHGDLTPQQAAAVPQPAAEEQPCCATQSASAASSALFCVFSFGPSDVRPASGAHHQRIGASLCSPLRLPCLSAS